MKENLQNIKSQKLLFLINNSTLLFIIFSIITLYFFNQRSLFSSILICLSIFSLIFVTLKVEKRIVPFALVGPLTFSIFWFVLGFVCVFASASCGFVFLCVCACLSVCVRVCLYVYLSVRLSVCPGGMWAGRGRGT